MPSSFSLSRNSAIVQFNGLFLSKIRDMLELEAVSLSPGVVWRSSVADVCVAVGLFEVLNFLGGIMNETHNVTYEYKRTDNPQ